MALVTGQGAKVGKPEVIVVVDATAPDDHGAPTVDWGLSVEIPPRVLRDLFDDADVYPVIVRNGVVVYAPGELNLGRRTRHPNRAQRRTLRGLYPTCGIPGCGVAYDYCDLHHVIWWLNNGKTDLANLLPLCSRHHHAVHDQGWKLVLDRNRNLTVTLPDGTVLATGPPKRNAA